MYIRSLQVFCNQTAILNCSDFKHFIVIFHGVEMFVTFFFVSIFCME